MVVSVVKSLAAEPAGSLRSHLDRHGVKSVGALIASTVARHHHRHSHYERFGVLGAATGPVVPADGGYQLPTELGTIQLMDYRPTSKVSYNCTVDFIGFQINETDETYDEPYLVVGCMSLAPEYPDDEEQTRTFLIKPLGDDHKKDFVHADTQPIWTEQQYIGGTGIKLIVFGYEEDSGDPTEVEKEINAYLKEKTKQGAQAVGAAFGVGAEAGAVADSPELQFFLGVISFGLAGWIGDDEVGKGTLDINVSDLKRYAQHTKDGTFDSTLKDGPGGIRRYNETVEVSGSGDGKYTAYFRVSVAEIPPQDIPKPASP